MTQSKNSYRKTCRRTSVRGALNYCGNFARVPKITSVQHAESNHCGSEFGSLLKNARAFYPCLDTWILQPRRLPNVDDGSQTCTSIVRCLWVKHWRMVYSIPSSRNNSRGSWLR